MVITGFNWFGSPTSNKELALAIGIKAVATLH
jgi:hypothetical protein